VVEDCERLGALAERWGWRRARRLDDLPDAILLDVMEPLGRKETLLERWAGLGWQPVCILSLVPEPGTSKLGNRLALRGYVALLEATQRRVYWSRLQACLAHTLRAETRLLPPLIHGLGCFDPEVVRALTIAMRLIPEHRTVARWAEEAGYARRNALEQLFAQRGLPHPKSVYEALHVVRMLGYGARHPERASRAQLARLFEWNPDYLGKRAKDMFGVSFGRLVELGPDGAITLITRRWQQEDT
jgi:hypothetical protein